MATKFSDFQKEVLKGAAARNSEWGESNIAVTAGIVALLERVEGSPRANCTGDADKGKALN